MNYLLFLLAVKEERQHETYNADHQRANDGSPEIFQGKIYSHHLCDAARQPEHGGVGDEREQTQGDDIEAAGQEENNGLIMAFTRPKMKARISSVSMPPEK